MVTVSCTIPADPLPLSTSTSEVALRVIILRTCLVSTSEEGVVKERFANAATSGSHGG